MHDTVALLYDTKPPKLYRTALHIRDYQLEAAPVVVLYRLQVSHYQNLPGVISILHLSTRRHKIRQH